MKNIRYVISLLLGIGWMGCGAPEAENPQQLVENYRKQIEELQNKIALLEADMVEDEPTEKGVYVRVAEVMSRSFEVTVDAIGKLQPENEALLAPEQPGRLTQILVKEGAYVQKGTLLARTNTQAVERQIASLKVQLELAATLYEKRQRLWQEKVGSEIELLQAKSNKENLEQQQKALQAQYQMGQIKAPFAGIIETIDRRIGELCGGTSPFGILVNTQKLKLYADISEIYLPTIHKGDPVQIYFPTLTDSLTAFISRISSRVDGVMKTIRIRINLSNRQGKFKPNMSCSVRLTTYKKEQAIVVPTILLRSDFNGEYLFLAVETSQGLKAKKQYIQKGQTFEGQTEILYGVKEGDFILSDGYDNVADGVPLLLKRQNN